MRELKISLSFIFCIFALAFSGSAFGKSDSLKTTRQVNSTHSIIDMDKFNNMLPDTVNFYQSPNSLSSQKIPDDSVVFLRNQLIIHFEKNEVDEVRKIKEILRQNQESNGEFLSFAEYWLILYQTKEYDSLLVSIKNWKFDSKTQSRFPSIYKELKIKSIKIRDSINGNIELATTDLNDRALLMFTLNQLLFSNAENEWQPYLPQQDDTFVKSNSYRNQNQHSQSISNFEKSESEIKKEEQQNDKNFERISKAINQNNLKKINKLVSTNYNIELKGKQGETPLLYAIKRNKMEMVNVLINAGANISAVDMAGNGVLHFTLKYGVSDDVFKKFVELGADLNHKNISEYTPLHYSIIYHRYDLISFLINNGADPKLNNYYNENALHLAIKADNDEILRFMLNQPINIEQPTKYNETPLLLAMRYQRKDMVKELLKAGAEISEFYLDDAIWIDYKNIVEILFEKGMQKPLSCIQNDDCFRTAFTYSVFAGIADVSEQLALYKNALNIYKLAKEKYRTDLGIIQAKEAAFVILFVPVIVFSVLSGSGSALELWTVSSPINTPSSDRYKSYKESMNVNHEIYPSINNFIFKEKKYLKQQLKLCNAQIREIKNIIAELENQSKKP